jgi:hypothetical protein
MATEFITFEARGRDAECTVHLKRAIPLFDEAASLRYYHRSREGAR